MYLKLIYYIVRRFDKRYSFKERKESSYTRMMDANLKKIGFNLN